MTMLLLLLHQTITGVQSLGIQMICQDRVSNCDDYSKDDCKMFPHWATRNCAKTCGLCTICPDGWYPYKEDQTCLKLFGADKGSNSHTWDDARTVCKNSDGDLVEIRNQKKNQFVLDMLDNQNYYVWIGLRNVAMMGFSFQFVDGSPLKDSYHPWLVGNPDNYEGKEKCVHMYPKGTYSGRWNDNECRYAFPFVCSRPYNTITVI